jgi:hypothetical protein
MFDDPILPIALFGIGPRAAAELAGLIGLIVAWSTGLRVGGVRVAPEWAVVAYSLVIASLGVKKSWWSLGDLINFSGASALRAKPEGGPSRPLSLFTRAVLAVADPLIYAFMRSPTVKTVFVDRRPGPEAKVARTQVTRETIRIAARGDPVWVFFEGGRSRDPDRIQPARRGIGEAVWQLCRRQEAQAVVFAIHHRGLESVMPIGSSSWIHFGHRIDVRWKEVDLPVLDAPPGDDQTARDPQAIADAIRAAVVELQSAWRSESEARG